MNALALAEHKGNIDCFRALVDFPLACEEMLLAPPCCYAAAESLYGLNAAMSAVSNLRPDYLKALLDSPHCSRRMLLTRNNVGQNVFMIAAANLAEDSRGC